MSLVNVTVSPALKDALDNNTPPVKANTPKPTSRLKRNVASMKSLLL